MRRRILVGLASTLTASLLLAAEPFDLTVLDAGVPLRLVAGERVSVALRLRNDGAAPWSPGAGYFIAPHWRDSDGDVVQWDGARTPLPGTVRPGDDITVDALLDVPDQPGSYLLQWDVVQEGVRWLSEVDPTPPAAVPVTVQAGHAFSVVAGSRPLWLRPGAEARERLVVRNDGSLPWTVGSGFALSYHWFSRSGAMVSWDGERTPVERTLAPGDAMAIEARLQAPDQPGLYRLQWDMVQEHVAWFSAHDPSPEPRRLVFVVSPPSLLPAALVVATLVAGWLAVAGVRRGRPGWLLGWVAVADLVWCAISVVVGQTALLAATGQRQGWGGRLLTWAGAVALLVPLLLVPRRWRAWASWGVAAAATCVIFADAVYARFFGDFLSVAVVAGASQLGQAKTSVLSLLRAGDIWLWLNLLAGLPLILAARRAPRPPGRRLRLSLVAVMLSLLVGGAAAGAALATGGGGVLRQVFSNLYLARDLGVLNYHALDIGCETLRSISRSEVPAGEVERTADWFAARAPLRAGVGPAFGAATGRNLLMIQVESLQGFVIGLEVGSQEVTPFLNRFVKDALLFSNVTDQTGAGRSSDSELLTQASLLPPAHQVAAFRYPSNHFTGLAGILQEKGYRTVSAIPFTGSFWNRRLTHRAFGYATSLFAPDFAPGETIGWGLDDRAFFDQMTPRLEGLREPFCAWLITLSLHHPFAGFPDRYKILDLGEREGTPYGNYLHTMSFFDRALEALVRSMERNGLLDRTVMVLWGDHDAGLEWNQDLARTAGEPFDAAGWYLSQRVPLIIRVPGRPDLTGIRRVAAGQQDVAPTVLALLGVDPAPYAFIGRNLLGSAATDPVIGEYGCWQDGELLYLRRGPTLAEGECYRLEGLERIPPDGCRQGFLAAERQQEASRAVLEHDLQPVLNQRLTAGLGGAG